ncbi:MAG: molybdopterin-dependent oxidoreductase [Pyrinomonadaceae bacterium]
MSEENKSDENKSKDGEVLLEKVRELETRKREVAAADSDKINTAKILGEKMEFTPVMTDEEAKQEMFRRSRRGFLVGGAAVVFSYLGYSWLRDEKQAWMFDRAFKFNESVAQTFYSPARLAPQFPRERVGNLRVNGGEGMSAGFDPATWKLQVVGVANQQRFSQYTDNIAYETMMNNQNEMKETNQLHENKDAKQNPNAPEMPPATMDRAAASQMPMPGLLLTLDDIKALPRTEMTTELKCIEGWSTIVNWAGARFSDFAAVFVPEAKPYISLVTPDGGYYVGMDVPSMMHPQTLLCYEMNGAPLTLEHGAPLRLVTPTKYGIKQIKRIGRISFTDERPADFWGERGYDWYSGH